MQLTMQLTSRLIDYKQEYLLKLEVQSTAHLYEGVHRTPDEAGRGTCRESSAPRAQATAELQQPPASA